MCKFYAPNFHIIAFLDLVSIFLVQISFYHDQNPFESSPKASVTLKHLHLSFFETKFYSSELVLIFEDTLIMIACIQAGSHLPVSFTYQALYGLKHFNILGT